MAYSVEILPRAIKEIDKLDVKTQKLVAAYIEQTLEGCENPRAIPNSKSIKGKKNGWRWRVGSYRLLGVIYDKKLVIELFAVGHRSHIYRTLKM